MESLSSAPRQSVLGNLGKRFKVLRPCALDVGRVDTFLVSQLDSNLFGVARLLRLPRLERPGTSVAVQHVPSHHEDDYRYRGRETLFPGKRLTLPDSSGSIGSVGRRQMLGHFHGIMISMAVNPVINITNIIALPRK